MTAAPHSDRAHAKLAPSAASRWINCPGSIRLSEGMPEQATTTFAAEGTAAHELAAHCLMKGFDTDRFLGTVIDISANGPGAMFGNRGLTDPLKRFEVTEEMAEGVQSYVDHVRSLFMGETERRKDVEVDIEHRFDLTHIHGEMFGTGDAVVYDPVGKHLYVVDLKYGRGIAVEAENNVQLLTYGVGALKRYHNREVEHVTLTIVQPRAHHADGPVRSWSISNTDLRVFALELKGHASACEADDAPLKAGSWCKFCPAAPICPEMRQKSLALAQAEFGDAGIIVPEPETLSPDKLGEILREVNILEDWCRRVMEYAHGEATEGRTPTGFKLVAKRATRKWKDEDLVKTSLPLLTDLDDTDMYSEPKLKSVAQMEKTIGKATFAEIESRLVVKNSSGTVLAPEGDKRPAVKMDAAQEFGAA